MAYTSLTQLLSSITPDPREGEARRAAQAHWASIAKPLGSLGVLETILEDMAFLTLSPDLTLEDRTLVVFCADNGVVAQGVTQTGQEVTTTVTRHLGEGRAVSSKMAALARCRVLPVDVGVRDLPPTPGVLERRIRNGTADITCGPAMTRAEAEEAILLGANLALQEKDRGCRLLATGEMGIGNTTTSSAVASVLLGRPPQEMTGRGAGLSDAALTRKISAIGTSLSVNKPDPTDPVDVLAKVGGLDLAGLCGVFLGGAASRVPVLVDGFISAVAALCAQRLCPQASKAIFATHVSAEPAGKAMLDALGKTPFLTAGMRLGEGTGALAALPVLDMALAVYREGESFGEYGVETYVPQGG